MSKDVSDLTRKILYILIPILETSLDTRAYNKDNLLIFMKMKHIYYINIIKQI